MSSTLGAMLPLERTRGDAAPGHPKRFGGQPHFIAPCSSARMDCLREMAALRPELAAHRATTAGILAAGLGRVRVAGATVKPRPARTDETKPASSVPPRYGSVAAGSPPGPDIPRRRRPRRAGAGARRIADCRSRLWHNSGMADSDAASTAGAGPSRPDSDSEAAAAPAAPARAEVGSLLLSGQ
jgi:hypothetical protein